MDWLKNSIRNRLLLVSGTGIVLMLAASFFNFWLMLVVALLSFYLSYSAVTKLVYTPAHQLIKDMERLAQGDFTTAITNINQDGIGKIAASAELMRKNLMRCGREIAGRVADFCSNTVQSGYRCTQVTAH